MMPAEQNTAGLAASWMSAPSVRHIPPPYAGPLIAAMIGCGMRHRGHDVAHVRHRAHRQPREAEVLGVGRDAPVVQVEAGAERAAGAGQHDDPRVVVVAADLVERLVQRLDQRERHRVQPLGLVERDHAHVRADVAIDQNQCHGAHRSDARYAGSNVPPARQYSPCSRSRIPSSTR